MEAGGFAINTVGEDMEIIVRLHQRGHQTKKDYQIVFVPEPVCWTEVPERWATLHRQRNRWQRGTVESLVSHDQMVFNPKFGGPGMFAVPYFVVFEMLGPVMEMAGYVLTLAGVFLHMVSLQIAALFFAVSVLFGVLLSLCSFGG